MAFPSNEGTTSLEPVWAAMLGQASRVKRKAQSLRAATLSPCTATLILSTVRDIINARTAMQALSSTPGLEAYGRTQINNPTLDLAAEFATMIAAINNVRDWVFNNIPKEAGTGYLLTQTISTELVVTEREFSSVSLGGLRTVLDALIAAIN
jgi:hypothetical protein